jgi:tetratricopeptide (TPR) repeat protein
MLWAGRDYALTEEYFVKAHALAAATGDRALIAQTYNRIGNCHVNRNQMEQAVAAHQRALALFEELHDEQGLLETLDYLGMANFLCGDFTMSAQYYERSLTLASRFDDRPRMIVALTISAMGSSTLLQTNSIAPADITPPGNLPAAIAKIHQGYTLAQTSHLRSQEAFCMCILAMTYCSYGDLGQSQHYADQAIQLAAALEHTQWLVFSHVSAGHAAHTIFDHASAQTHLELAVQLAESIGSLHWHGVSTGALASAYLSMGEVERAADVLSRALPPGTPARMVGQRAAWCARVELALAQHNPELALQHVELLLADVPDSARDRSILRVHLLYGHALTALGRLAEAEAKYHMALHVAESQQARTDQWRILAALSRLYDLQGHAQKLTDAMTQARAVAMAIADTLNDPAHKVRMLDGIERSLTPGSDMRFI